MHWMLKFYVIKIIYLFFLIFLEDFNEIKLNRILGIEIKVKIFFRCFDQFCEFMI